ncbi:MAG: cyclic pyranopterin monophosphate synthase MoaC [Armatimonadetes bacterium]|nr:MAG: cyclic pyranopterin monophosphate synthase MoaC [Armatimonadota bacterium]
MTEMNHLNKDGTVRMVDVGAKGETERRAVAIADVAMNVETIDRLFSGGLPKGDALATVRIAAIQATKRTPELIPLCHPLQLSGVDVTVDRTDSGAQISVEARLTGRTGVEMEAMTGAAVGALALYDMIKGIDRSACISSVRLVHKSGGKSGQWNREPVES